VKQNTYSAGYFLGLFFDTDEEDSMFFEMKVNFLPDDTASHPRRDNPYAKG
jgi:hypothetical protein